MEKRIASLVVCFLVLTLLVGAVPVAASSPFGPGAVRSPLPRWKED